MDDEELVKQFIELRGSSRDIELWVKTITWAGQRPIVNWEMVEKLPSRMSGDKIIGAIKNLLLNETYFEVCDECGERHPVGWMHDDKICQGCAQENHGVVY